VLKRDYRGNDKKVHNALTSKWFVVAHNLNDIFIKEICLRTTVLHSVCALSEAKGIGLK